MKVQRSFSSATKHEVVRRYLSGESATLLGREFSIRPTLVFQWKDVYLRKGAAGLGGVGRPGRAQMLEGLKAQPLDDLADPLVLAQRKIALLEQKIAQQALDIDFFKLVLPPMEKPRPLSVQPGAQTSMPSSTGKRRGKTTS